MTTPRCAATLSIASLVLLLAACTGSGSSTASAGRSSPTATPTATASPTEAPTPTPSPTPSPNTELAEAWAATAAAHRGLDGERFEYDCPAGGLLRFVWGTDVYTDDSSVCTAGVHVGVITLEDGGTVTIEIRPGQDAYEATERNGVSTLDYGPWGGSYVVIDE
jgi:LCCL domain